MPRPLLTASAILGSLALVPLATSAMAAVDTDTYREFDQFLDVFNNSALLPAVPEMSAETGMTAEDTVWIFSAYQLTFAAFLLLVSAFFCSSAEWMLTSWDRAVDLATYTVRVCFFPNVFCFTRANCRFRVDVHLWNWRPWRDLPRR